MSTSKAYTTDDLLASIIARTNIPEGQITYQPEDLLRFANEEMDENVCPLVLSTREEFYLTYQDIPLLAGVYKYTIPYRAYGSKVRIIKPLSGDNTEGYPLSHIPIDISSEYGFGYFASNTSGFYLQNDEIVFTQTAIGAGIGTIRVYFYIRPNDLVLTERVAVINAIDRTTNTVNVDSIPTGMNSNELLDLIQALPNNRIQGFDLSAAVNVANKMIIFNNTLPERLAVGDYVCFASETPVPNLPADIRPLLEQSVACKVLESNGDTQGLENGLARLAKIEKNVLKVIASRVESPGKKLKQVNSLLGNRGRYRSGGY